MHLESKSPHHYLQSNFSWKVLTVAFSSTKNIFSRYMHGIHAAEKLVLSESEKCVAQFVVPKCGFHAVLNNSWGWMMSKYVFLLNIFVDLFDVQHKAIIAIIFCRFSLEVSCPCLFLRETIQKHSNSFLVLHFRLWHFNSFKAAEVVTIFMTWWKPSHCRHEFPLIRLSWIP